MRFERLVVIGRGANTSDGHVYWLCRCDCGKETYVRSNHLAGGKIRSCGCLKQEGGSHRLPHGEAGFNAIVGHYIKSAKRRHYDYDLTRDQVRAIIGQNCHYCGAEPAQGASYQTSAGAYIYNGIDRLDSRRGYTPDNVVPCCGRCNYAKGKMGYSEFMDWIKRVYAYNYGAGDAQTV